jgi:hypothetical protein
MDRKDSRTMRIATAALVAGAALAGILPGAAAQAQDQVAVHVSPALPAEGDALTVSADVMAPPNSSPGAVNVDHSLITLYVDAPIVSPPPPEQLQHLVWQLPLLPAGGYKVSVSLVGAPNLGFIVQPRATTFALIGARFQVTVSAGQPGANPAAVQLSDAGGYFSYFQPEDVEITVKMVDGRQVNGHYWVFIASMTDTPFTATLVDTSVAGCSRANNCPTRTYTNPASTNQNFIDVDAF